MSLELSQVALISFIYLGMLFAIASITDRGWIPERVVRHPITYILSLGVFASAWSFYGIVDLAYQFGYGALAYYLGTGAVFLFAPVALAPLAEIARRYQIRSIADLLVFRFHSHTVGSVTTLCMLLAVLPLMALQLQVVSDTLSILTANSGSTMYLTDRYFEEGEFDSRTALALAYCAILAGFTILFGSRTEKHNGLITAMAFESLVKVVALVAVGLLALFSVFGGLEGLDQWLQEHPENQELLYSPIRDTASHTLLLVFIATTVAMPHIFHMSVVENPMKSSLNVASWAFPLFLFVMALPVFPILWAGFELNVPLPTQYFTLGVPMAAGNKTLSVVAFLGGLSAATGALISIALSLTTMLLNHWLLPLFKAPLFEKEMRHDLYQQLLWLRRLLVLAIFIAGYLFFQLIGNQYSLTNLALMAFSQALQFIPGIFSVSYWPRGNRTGFLAGVIAGSIVWMVGFLVPIFTGIEQLPLFNTEFYLPLGFNNWNGIAVSSIGINVLIFVGVSLLTKTSPEERHNAELCAADEVNHPLRLTLDVHSADEFKQRLSQRLGSEIANNEVDKALKELSLPSNERRLYSLRRLRSKLEANLSGLMGIGVANEILENYIPYKIPDRSGSADINLIENRFTRQSSSFTGITAELNNLRLYHRKTLQELPIAICSLGPDLEVLMWNNAMVALTGISSDEVTGSHLSNLAEPWNTLIAEFSASHDTHFHNRSMLINNEPHWFTLHKATIEGPVADSADGQVILIEDVTEVELLEKELVHSERLASVGRLAAGVAHEIGNPVTGIACLAQNIQYDTNDSEMKETAEQILLQTQRIDRIVKSLMTFSHTGHQHPKDFVEIDLSNSVNEAIHLLSLQQDKNQVEFHNQLTSNCTVKGDAQRIIQVFVNLLSNARDASPDGTPVIVSGESSDAGLLVHVTDQGMGIAPAQLERVLEPFFTTKDPGEGTGLGLAMVYSIINDHDGTVDVISPFSSGGVRITLRFPHPPTIHH